MISVVAGVGFRKPVELSEEEMFTAFVHCGALLDPEREDVRGRDEHALKLQ